jgi:hypothetical protein
LSGFSGRARGDIDEESAGVDESGKFRNCFSLGDNFLCAFVERLGALAEIDVDETDGALVNAVLALADTFRAQARKFALELPS